MGDNSRYIGPYVLGKTNDKWEDDFDGYCWGRSDKLKLETMKCFAYGSIPLFIPNYLHSVGRFEDYITENHDIGGGTVAFNVDAKMIDEDISRMKKKCAADLKKLRSLFGPLTLKWGLVTQYG